MCQIHDRMPVIVAPEDYGVWLDGANKDIERLKGLLGSYPAKKMKTYPVSRVVSSAKNEGAALLDRLEVGVK